MPTLDSQGFPSRAGTPVSDPAILAQLNAPDTQPIQIKAPDGSLVEFPAGTSDDTITTAMRKAYPSPSKATPRDRGQKVTDPALLSVLEGTAHPLVAAHTHLTSDAPIALNESGQPVDTRPDAEPNQSAWERTKRVGGVIDSTVRSLANGLPFSDRFAAGMGALTGVGGKFGDYSGNLEAQRAEDQKLSETAPGVDTPVGRLSLDTAGHLVGGALVPVGALSKVGTLAKDTPLGIKTIVGALTGAGVGGVQGLSSTKDLTDVPQAAKDTAIGVGTGAGIGAIVPGVAKVIGTGANAVLNAAGGRVEGMSRGASAPLLRAIEADGPTAVQARMAELGPDAMMLDGGAAMLGTAQGAAGNSMEARSVLTNALKARDRGTNARIQNDVDSAIGPAQEDAQTTTDAIRAHRSAVDSANYTPALENAPPVQMADVLYELDARIAGAPVGSMEHRALTNARNMMMTTERRPMMDVDGRPLYDRAGNERFEEVPASVDDAGILHKTKQEIDRVIEYGLPGLGIPAGALQNQQGALKLTRGSLNAALEDQVPNYLEANRASAALANRAEAVQAGTQILGNGKTIASPARFATDFEAMEPGERIAMAKGLRADVERALGTQGNDLVKLKGTLQGEGKWNSEKLATVYGRDAADELAASVERNRVFRDSHQKIVENSQTDMRNAARKEMRPDPSTDTPLINPNATMTGIASTVGKMGLQKVVNALTQSDPTRHFGELARALTEQGTARDARLLAVSKALGSRQGNAVTAEKAGSVGAVVAAILAREGVDEIRGGPTRKQR